MKDSFTTNTALLRKKIRGYLQFGNQRFLETPERSLLEAYQSAQIIKNIELDHFAGQKISPESVDYTESVMSYWQVYLAKNLSIIKVKLAEFRLSRSLLNTSNSVFLEKLKFIDDVIAKYIPQDELIESAIVPIEQPLPIINQEVMFREPILDNTAPPKNRPKSDKTGVLPRSIGRTIDRIKADLSPQGEQQFVRNFRISRNKTRSAVRFLVLLILVPVLTQNISKHFLVKPIVERIQGESKSHIFLNSEMEEEAFQELKTFEKKLQFKSLITKAPPLSTEEKEEQVKEKALELVEEFRDKSTHAISNVFADVISLLAFGIIVATSRREIAIVKSFMDEIVYGISDSAKAFLIILSTDIFVGFHSPHGWEVLLEGTAEHLGLPANRNAIFLFIATFPVILNTVFKYWIFRYLSKWSPSALATMKEMDE
ncbi:MAG: proton extrusion protein PcxA [Rhizonema sp. PD38]|nr:proton extrusion protein PcxA [Rhizonema sp. PD38]